MANDYFITVDYKSVAIHHVVFLIEQLVLGH